MIEFLIMLATLKNIIVIDIPQPIPIFAEVTAYTARAQETDDTPNINAAGRKPKVGDAACPRYIALGQEIIIKGRIYTCQDRMSLKYPDRYDILMETIAEARQWGIQKLSVTVL